MQRGDPLGRQGKERGVPNPPPPLNSLLSAVINYYPLFSSEKKNKFIQDNHNKFVPDLVPDNQNKFVPYLT